MQVATITLHRQRPAAVPVARPDRSSRLARLGDWLRDHRRLIIGLQWLIVGAYAFLLIGPTLLPLPDETAHVWNHLTVAAQFAFWGLWWPFVLLSMVGLGRVWCGVLCPEGALTEFASRFARRRPIPRWLRWGGWPFVAFALTTIYGQLVSVYQYPQAVLLVLGGSTVAAVAVGLLYARERRVWCRYLCPVSGVFGLLAKLAPLHYKTDEDAWHASTAAGERPSAPACGPLLSMRGLDSASDCHACGRCSGHRQAVSLRARRPNAEIVGRGERDAHPWQTALLLFGMIGLAMGAFEWSASPWLVSARQTAAEWLVNRDIYWPLDANAPWWLLTHYPENNDAFTWLDGALLLGYMLGSMVLVGGAAWALLRGGAHLLGARRRLHHLALALVPLAGAGLFLGLSATTLGLLRAEQVPLDWVPATRALILGAASLWTLWLGWQISGRYASGVRRLGAAALLGLTVALIDTGWALWFWIW